MSRNGTSAIYKPTYYLGIVYAKLATSRSFVGVSTYHPNLEVLCLERVWNTRSATKISSLRPSGGQKYICLKVFPMTRTTSKAEHECTHE
jgi:hypothetical protein